MTIYIEQGKGKNKRRVYLQCKNSSCRGLNFDLPEKQASSALSSLKTMCRACGEIYVHKFFSPTTVTFEVPDVDQGTDAFLRKVEKKAESTQVAVAIEHDAIPSDSESGRTVKVEVVVSNGQSLAGPAGRVLVAEPYSVLENPGGISLVNPVILLPMNSSNCVVRVGDLIVVQGQVRGAD